MTSRPLQKFSGRKLAKLRKGLFLSQNELAEKVGLTECRVRQIERADVAGMPLNRVPAFAAALKMTPGEFVVRLGVAPAPAASSTAVGLDASPETLLLTLPDHLDKQLRAQAQARNMSVAALICNLVEEALGSARHGGKRMRLAAKRM